MVTDPTEEQLREFVAAMLSNLDRQLREPDVIDQAIREHRHLWVMIYRASAGLEIHEPPS